MTAIIRARREDEIDACAALLAGVQAADGYPMHWPADPRGWLTPPGLLAAWVAVDEDGVVAGHVALCAASGDAATPVWPAASGLPAERLAAVTRLFVAPWARGHGLGAALLDTARAEACARGLRAALEVLERDRAALALYERAGWQRVASAPAPWAHRHGEPAVLHYYLAPDQAIVSSPLDTVTSSVQYVGYCDLPRYGHAG